MLCVKQKYADNLGSQKKKKYVLAGCFLCKKISRKHFIQHKKISFMATKTTFSLMLPRIYYAFDCSKYI